MARRSSRRRSRHHEEETLVDLVEARDSAEHFFEENRNIIIGIVMGLVLLVGAIAAYKYLYKEPREAAASDAMYRAESMFAVDSFARALDNPGGGGLGFLDIIDQYGNTRAGNTARYYAGVSWLRLGKYEAAIDLLADYKPKGNLLPTMKHTALGDAYAEMDDLAKAESHYKKAAAIDDNSFLTPYALKKLGMFYEFQNKPEEARKTYEQLQQEYPNTNEGEEVEKYIMRLQ